MPPSIAHGRYLYFLRCYSVSKRETLYFLYLSLVDWLPLTCLHAVL